MCLFDYNLAKLKRTRNLYSGTIANGATLQPVKANPNRTALVVGVFPVATFVAPQFVALLTNATFAEWVGILTQHVPMIVMDRQLLGDLVAGPLFINAQVEDEITIFVQETYLDIDPNNP